MDGYGFVTHLVLAGPWVSRAGEETWQASDVVGSGRGTFPDLDILLAPFQDDIGFLTHHRGITHCLLFVLVVGSILGWLVGRWYGTIRASTSCRSWVLLFLICLLTHVLLDACTTYGTPLFLPWSDYRVAFNNIFIVDPLLTLPLLLGMPYCLLRRPDARRRQLVSYAALAVSCLYLGTTFVSKYAAQGAFAASLAEEGIAANRFRLPQRR